MQLEDFYDYKNQLMEDILSTHEIVHLLDKNIKIEDATKLAYSQVFPFEFVPETNQEALTYVCFDVDITKSYSSNTSRTYYYPTIYVWVFTHKSLLRLDSGGVRTDKLCAAICKKINGSYNYGLGELELQSVKRFAPMTDYQGKAMAFDAKDFGSPYDPSRKIPTNRKRNL